MLHVLTHSFPYRRSVDLHVVALQVVADARLPGGLQLDAVVGHQGPRALAGAASATSFPLQAATPFKSPRLKPTLQVLRTPGRILTCPAGAASPASPGPAPWSPAAPPRSACAPGLWLLRSAGWPGCPRWRCWSAHPPTRAG